VSDMIRRDIAPMCSIIVLNWNGKEHLAACLESLGKINYPRSRYEVIFVDNGSTDGSVDFVKKKFKWVRVLALGRNYGFDEGNNRGIRAAKGKYIVIMNNDTSVARDWLKELVRVADSDERIGVCGSKIVDPKGRAGGEGYLNLLGVPTFLSTSSRPKECFWVSDCSSLIKREVVRKLGQVYDPEFFAYFEEVDVCWRVRMLGYKVVYVPSSVIYHKESATSVKAGPIRKYWHYRNKIWTFRRNTRPPLTQIVMVPIAVSTLLTSVYLSLTGEWNYGITALRHMFDKKEKSAEAKRVSLKEQLKLFRI